VTGTTVLPSSKRIRAITGKGAKKGTNQWPGTKYFVPCNGGKLPGHSSECSGECSGVNWHPGVLAHRSLKISVTRTRHRMQCQISSLHIITHVNFRFNHGRGFPLSIGIDAAERGVRLAFSQGDYMS
jgi:hypothetical protein